MHVNQTIDRNTHSQSASISAIIDEQKDIRKLVEDLASRLDRSQEENSATQSELSTNALLEINDLKSKVSRLTEQSTKLDGDVSFLSRLSDQVELLWKCRLPERADDESQEKIVSAAEVQEELDELKNVVYRKLKEMLTSLNTLRESVRLIENDKEESWEALSHKVSTVVEDSVGSLTDRLTELEHTVQSQRTTPVTEDDVLNMKTWSTLEVIWSELGKVKAQAQEVPNMYTLCEELHENQKSQEKQLSGLRSFARRVEQFLTQMKAGAVAPRESHATPTRRGETNDSLGCVPDASASSSTVSASLAQTPTPPLVPAPPIPTKAGAVAPRESHATPTRRGETSESLGYVPAVSVSSSAMSASLQTPTPPTIPAPPIPTEASPQSRENVSLSPKRDSTTRFSTVRSEVRSGAIRIDITNPQQWSAGDVAVIRNQEAKKVRNIGSLIFETPIQHDYEAGVEVRSLLPTEQLEETDGRLAVLDVDPATGTRFVKFGVDEIPFIAAEESPVQRRERDVPVYETIGRDTDRGSPDFGGGVDYHVCESSRRERIPPRWQLE